MANRRITIKEIAKIAGVSPSAVSFAINGRKGVSEATKKRILSVIKDMNFHPSAASQRLVLRKSFNIAFIYPTVTSPFTDLFYYEVANGLTEEFTSNSYNVVFTPHIGNDSRGGLPNIIKRQDADGAVFLHDTPKTLLNELDEMELPYVLVDWQSSEHHHINVSLDCEQSIFDAVMYLFGKGHTQIAFCGSDRLPSYYLRCFTGYKNAMLKAGLPINPGWICSMVYDAQTAAVNVEKYMSLQNRPTAVCCMSDMCAVYAMQSAVSLGIGVPEQLSFIGIDDILLGQFTQPQLTTVSYQKSKIGKVAAQILMRLIDGEPADSAVVHSDAIVERQSVRTIG